MAKITISFVLIVLGGTSVSIFIGSRIITSAMRNEALKQVRRGLETASIVYAVRQEDVRKAVAAAASKERLAAAVDTGSFERLPHILSALRREGSLDFLSYVDIRRRQVVRGDESGKQPSAAATLPIPDFLARARAGKEAVGTEVLDAASLMQENPVLPLRARIQGRQGRDPAAGNESTNYEIGAGIAAGPQAPCTAPLEILPPPLGSELEPTTPLNLQAVVSNFNTISLTWDASTDNVGVTSYGVYRNGLISGYKWSDLDADGAWDWTDGNANGTWDAGEGEPPLAGWTIYIDTDADRQLDWTDGNANGTWDEGEGEDHRVEHGAVDQGDEADKVPARTRTAALAGYPQC